MRRVDARLGVAEEVEFLGPAAPLFGCRHLPATRERSRLGVVICSPILTDFGANYRREVELARRLAAAGLCVQRFHPRGVGHSSGGRLDLTVATMIADTVRAVERLVETTDVDAVALVATRFSAMPAAAAARRLGPVPLVLWEPVTQARRYFREALRAHSVHQLKLGRTGIDDPAAELDRHGFLDVLGIQVGRELFETGPEHGLVEALGDEPRPVLLIQFEPREGLRPEYEQVVERWTGAGFEVTTALSPNDESWWFIPDRLAPADEVVATTATWLLTQSETTPMWGG
ncbi:MAG: hypothetical protein ACRD0A_19950, partial [Acidimicrobiales bacterium]